MSGYADGREFQLSGEDTQKVQKAKDDSTRKKSSKNVTISSRIVLRVVMMSRDCANCIQSVNQRHVYSASYTVLHGSA